MKMHQMGASIVDKYGTTVCPFVMQSLHDGSESFNFCASDVLICAMTACKCFNDAKSQTIGF